MWLKSFLPFTRIAQVGQRRADDVASLWQWLKDQGTPIPSSDLWVAALACQHDLPLLSNDHHFDDLPEVNRVSF
ncbi:hypothetical protein OAG53_01645 [Akkermansiaceae bacterium]|nr:hypothetical protein [Akkermansiaceae bacterium]